MKRLLITYCTLCITGSISGQFVYWNTVYFDQSTNSNFLYNTILKKDTTYLTCGFGFHTVIGEVGWSMKRMDTLGNELESKFTSASFPFSGIEECVVELSNGDYIGIGTRPHGTSSNHPYMGYLTTEWDTVWTHDYMEIVNDSLQIFPVGVFELNDEEILMASAAYLNTGEIDSNQYGYSYSFIDKDSGEINSDTTRWMSPDYFYVPQMTCQLQSDEVLVAGWFVHNEYDSFLMKTNMDGDILATKHWGNPDNCIDSEIEMNLISDTLLLVAYNYCYDYVNSFQKISKPHMLCMNPTTWEVYWDVEYDQPEFNEWGGGYTFSGVEPTPDGGYAMSFLYFPFDNSNLDYPTGILKVDQNGVLEWFKTYYPNVPNDQCSSSDMLVAADGGFVVNGEIIIWEQGLERNWVFKTDPCGDIQWVDCPGGVMVLESKLSDTSLNVWPNPSTGEIQIETSKIAKSLLIFNSMGQKMSEVIPNEKRLTFHGIEPGLYILKCFFANGTSEELKFVVE